MSKKPKGFPMDGYDKAVNPTKRSRGQDANYNYSRQVIPEVPMGHGSYANLPQDVMIRDFPHEPQYRDGIINGYTANINRLTDIEENQP